MSIKTNILFALILAFVAAPGFAQNRSGFHPPKKNTAELQKTKRILLDNAIAMSRKEKTGWVDISSAPSFPLPLFRGNQTKFFKPNTAAAAYLENSHNHNINILTKDPAASVYQFYARALPSAGFVIDTRYPTVAGKARVYTLKGDSPKASAAVSIASKDDPTGPGAQISITVFDTRPAPVKK